MHALIVRSLHSRIRFLVVIISASTTSANANPADQWKFKGGGLTSVANRQVREQLLAMLPFDEFRFIWFLFSF